MYDLRQNGGFLILKRQVFYMKKKLFWITIASLFSLCIIGLIVLMLYIGSTDKSFAGKRTGMVYVGDTPISDYIIVTHEPVSCSNAIRELNRLVYGKTENSLKVHLKGGDESKTIRLICESNYSGDRIIVSEGKIILYGTDSEDILKTVRIFANTYLGWCYAGEDREALLSTSSDVYMPEDVYFNEDPWIEEREPIICLWKTNVPRGQFYNTNASLTSEILTYSDDQLYEYVKMMKSFGYTGIQVTDMCSAWAQYSGYEFVHDRLRFMADAAHSLGMKFTLWVWGAEFTGYGWYDSSVVYTDNAYEYSYECPEAIETFNKYYDIYAELADCSDRVIMHFDDPSKIHKTEEIVFYANLFEEKVKAKNPNIDFGISDYTQKYDKYMIAEKLGSDVAVYSGAVTIAGSSAKGFREAVKETGLNYGIWSWNLCEMEIDQLAEMNVNANLIRSVYLTTQADGDYITVPEYWSEMDSYHIANIFSHYCAGRLLQEPALSADDILKEACVSLVGKENADLLYQVLLIVQDARTGESFETFKIGNEEYLLTSEEYPAEDIYRRCLMYLPDFEKLLKADIEGSTIPLPCSVSDVLAIVDTHLTQIKEFASFRVKLNEIEELYEQGADKETLREEIEKISDPIPAYDAIVGVWGQPEALAQYNLINSFCEKAGIEKPQNEKYIYSLKQYIYQEICCYQKNEKERLEYSSIIWSEMLLGEEDFRYVLDRLVDDGLIVYNENGTVSLTDWQNYSE